LKKGLKRIILYYIEVINGNKGLTFFYYFVKWGRVRKLIGTKIRGVIL